MLAGSTKGEKSPKADKDALRAEPPGRDNGHGRMHAEDPRLIGGRGHHPAQAAADDHRFAAQFRVVHLLHSGKKGVHIQVQNHGESGFAPSKAVP